MAVDLARRRRRDGARGRLAVRRVQLLVALVDVERPRERLLGAHSRNAGQALQQHVDLELRAFGPFGRLAQQFAQDSRGDAGEHMPGRVRPFVRAAHFGRAPVGLDRDRLGARHELRAGARRRSGKRARQRAHASDRHVPGPSDHVVEEAAVLPQQRIVGRRERSDQSVGQHGAAGEIVSERPLDQIGERGLEERVPEGVVADHPSELLARAQGLGQRGKRPVGDRRECGTRRGRVGRDPAGADLDRHAERAEQRRGEQADEIGVARQPHVEPGKRRRRDRSAADLVAPLEHDDRAAGARQQRGRDERVVTATDDHHIEVAALGHATNVLGPIASGERAPVDLV